MSGSPRVTHYEWSISIHWTVPIPNVALHMVPYVPSQFYKEIISRKATLTARRQSDTPPRVYSTL